VNFTDITVNKLTIDIISVAIIQVKMESGNSQSLCSYVCLLPPPSWISQYSDHHIILRNIIKNSYATAFGGNFLTNKTHFEECSTVNDQ
jgi:hypothetical protein